MPRKDPYRRPFLIGSAVVFVVLLAVLYVSGEAGKFGTWNLHLIGWTAMGIVVAGIVGVYVLIAAEGMWEHKRKYTVELANGKLIQRRAGGIVEISLDKIQSLEEGRRWLVVTGEAGNWIMVPREISDYDLLRRELSVHRTPVPLRRRVPLLSVLRLCLTLGLMVAAYVLLLTSHRRDVIAFSGAMAMMLAAGEMVPLLRRSRGKRLLIAIYYSFFLLMMVGFVYLRIRGRF